MQIAMYSSSSGGGSGGNGAGWVSTSACSPEMLVGGVVTLCEWASTSACSSEILVGSVVTLCEWAKADVVEAADCFAFLDRESYVVRNCPLVLNHIRDKRPQAMTTATTRLDRWSRGQSHHQYYDDRL